MNTPTTHIAHTARSLPRDTRTRMQGLLDEGDALFFVGHPGETERTRFYFRGERIDDTGEATRYIVVTRRPDGTLTRRFQRDGGTA